MLKSIYSLLITDSPDKCSNLVIREVLSDLGSLQINQEWEMKLFQERIYNLVVVDGAATCDLVKVASQISSRDSQVRIVVINSSPNWMEVKDTFRTGATDYLK